MIHEARLEARMEEFMTLDEARGMVAALQLAGFDIRFQEMPNDRYVLLVRLAGDENDFRPVAFADMREAAEAARKALKPRSRLERRMHRRNLRYALKSW